MVTAKPYPAKEKEKIAVRVSAITILGNIALSAVKLLAGIFAHSAAMMTDAIHSATDVVSTFVMVVGIKASAKEPDKTHPYGYERMENVAAIILAMILTVAALGIGASGLEKVLTGSYGDLAIPGQWALAAALISIASKEAMYWYTRHAAKEIDSSAMMADAWHHRSDAFSSIGSFIGIAGARMGFPIMDSIASIVICGFIMKAAVDVFRDAIAGMTDRAASEDVCVPIRNIIRAQRGVRGIKDFKTRMFGNKVYVEADVLTDGDMTVSDAASIDESIARSVERVFPEVKECTVRAVPCEGEEVQEELVFAEMAEE